jgi:prolyl-tRNA synthetase
MIRGDFEVNESKLKNHLRINDLKFASDAEIRTAGAEPGYASPIGLGNGIRIVVDASIAGSSNLVVGANEPDHHFRNFNLERDLPGAEAVDIATVREGDPCPITGAPLILRRGIEVGNIFQLGTKYSAAMNCTFLDRNGKAFPMVMGCYGIGVGRAMAAVIEQSHDAYGPVWPVSITPWHVQVCALDPNKGEVGVASERLYNEMTRTGLEVLYDDRGEKAGFMFNDADLIGIPFRIVVSPKTLADGEVEFKRRGEREGIRLSLDACASFIRDQVDQAFASLREIVPTSLGSTP